MGDAFLLGTDDEGYFAYCDGGIGAFGGGFAEGELGEGFFVDFGYEWADGFF